MHAKASKGAEVTRVRPENRQLSLLLIVEAKWTREEGLRSEVRVLWCRRSITKTEGEIPDERH